MNWEEVGAIGQVLGSIAVLVTLGYLSIQVRHARQEVRRSINQSRFETIRKFNMTYATDERLNSLRSKSHILLGGQEFAFARELIDRTGMTREEASALSWDQQAWWQYRTEMIPHLDELTQSERKMFEFGIRQYRDFPLSKLWYETSRQTILNPDIVRYVDNLLAQPGRFPDARDSSTLSPSTEEGMR